MIYSNNTYDITNDISTYARTDFKQVYDTSALKWYSLVDGTYEEDATQAAAPTIVSKWPSVMYTGGHYVSKLYRNDVEQSIWDYMSGDILRKGNVTPPAPVGPSNDEIWYTSSNGSIVTPYSRSALPEIDTNTYSDGKGVIKFKTNVTNIGTEAFYGRGYLTSVTFGNSVAYIGSYAFFNCASLNSISYTGTISQYKSINKGTSWHYLVPASVVHCSDGDTSI